MSPEVVSETLTILTVDRSDFLRQPGPELLRAGFQLEVLESFSTHCLRAPRPPAAALVRCPHPLSLLRTCQEIREEAGDMPLMVLSSRTDVETKILRFEMGADDYVEEPFAVEESIARLRSILRSLETNCGQRLMDLTGKGVFARLTKIEEIFRGHARARVRSQACRNG